LRRYIREIHEESMLHNAEFAEAQQREAEMNQELTIAMRTSLNVLVTQDMMKLSERVDSVDGALV
jgi:hypothetical protein